MSRRSNHRRRDAFSSNEDINPMDYIGNLSDAMLVLAVGMMLALIVAWQVPIGNFGEDSTGSSSNMTQVDMQDAETLDPDTSELETSDSQSDDSVPIEEYGLTEYGKVYVDSDGNMYVITEGD